MASYEYVCNDCKTNKINIRGINDPDPEILCDTCKKTMNRVYSLGAVTFNGSGFYSKDK